MEQISVLKQSERGLLNPDRIVQLKRQLGDQAAKEVVARAIEEIALRLEHVNERFSNHEFAGMRKCTRSLLAIADQVGLDTLTMVADDVLTCIDIGDSVATSATLDRLLRIGASSLTEIWEMQGVRV